MLLYDSNRYQSVVAGGCITLCKGVITIAMASMTLCSKYASNHKQPHYFNNTLRRLCNMHTCTTVYYTIQNLTTLASRCVTVYCIGACNRATQIKNCKQKFSYTTYFGISPTPILGHCTCIKKRRLSY